MENVQPNNEFWFENVNVLDEHMLCEVHKKMLVVNKIFTIIGLVMIGCSLFSFFRSLADYVIDIGILLSMLPWIVVVLMGVFGPKVTARKAMKSSLTISNGQPVVQHRQFGERIVSYTPNSVNIFDYAKIKRVYSLKNCYVLRFSQDSGILVLSRNGFTKGTFEEFKQFLRYKRPDLKIPE